MFGLFDFGKEDDRKEINSTENVTSFVRYENNPILTPDPGIPWKSKAVFNPAAIYLDDKVHLVYRAQSNDGVSVFGYAVSSDGLNISENYPEPIFLPSEPFEKPTKPGWNSGCEDPRITVIDDKLVMTYTAYDGTNPPRVALTSIKISDFLNKNFVWEKQKLISPPGVDDKDACIIKGQRTGLLAFHRLGHSIWIDRLKDLEFPDVKYLTGGILANARAQSWDNIKVGLASPPIETDEGLLLFYHAVCDPGFMYKIGAMILSYDDPHRIIARSDEPLLSPEKEYEIYGQVPNIVYSCGSVLRDGKIFLYYGGGDSVTCVATMPLSDLLNTLLKR